MAHEKHLIEGVILDVGTWGESGKILRILTVDHGVISVVSTGTREMYSKMRGNINILEKVEFEYVEGREVNRLTSIFPVFNLLKMGTDAKQNIKYRRVVSNITNFVLRTVVGDAHNLELYEFFLEGIGRLGEQNQFIKDAIFFEIFEVLWLIKILVSLGYWQDTKYFGFTEDNFASLGDLEVRKKLIEDINSAIESTHL